MRARPKFNADMARMSILTLFTSTKRSLEKNGTLFKSARRGLMTRPYDKLVCDHLWSETPAQSIAGEMTIHNMRETKPGYNLISNNCQNFATRMLDAIQIGAHREFATTFAIYQRATGKGAIKDLFAEPPDEHTASNQSPGQLHEATMQYAHQVMDENTSKLDCHDHIH